MDTFFEQIVSIRKDSKAIVPVLGILVAAVLLSAVLIYFWLLGSLTILLVFGIAFGAYKLATLFNVEYEYIITNGTLDIDKIINRSSRKRMLSFDLANVTRLEKYTPALLNNLKGKDITFACNKDDKNAYLLVAEREGKQANYLVFSPDDRLKGAIVKFVPKYIANSAFKNN